MLFQDPTTCLTWQNHGDPPTSSSYLSLADGDPHFVVEIPQSKLTVCFNINGEPGHILRLVTDHKHSGKQQNYTALHYCQFLAK